MQLVDNYVTLSSDFVSTTISLLKDFFLFFWSFLFGFSLFGYEAYKLICKHQHLAMLMADV